jgi:hypothetical protein
MGFHHWATEVWFPEDGKYKICDSSGEDPTCANSRVGHSMVDHVTYLGIDKRLGNKNGCK